jgi:hypothetical protein
MATEADVRRIAMALPGTEEGGPQLGFAVAHPGGKAKGYAWSWKERLDPKKARVENRAVLAVRVRDEAEKQVLIAGDPDVFFTEPHYDGYPAILVRLAPIDLDMLEKILTDGWRIQAPKRLLRDLAADA